MAQEYDIRYIEDALPERMHAAAPSVMFLEDEGGSLVLYLKQADLSPALLRRAWAAYRAIEPSPHVPEQRRRVVMRAVLSAGLLAASCAEGAALLSRVSPTPGGPI